MSNIFASLRAKVTEIIKRMRPAILFFSPHQDDELLTMGIHSCQIRSWKYDTHVILCTDGSKSSVRLNLNNGKNCHHHKGTHNYELSVDEFVAARDTEFRASCGALGYRNSAVHISPLRCHDGELTVEAAEQIITSTLKKFFFVKTVCTISPYGGSGQHPDHRNLGIAAMNLYEKKKIRNVEFLVEPYCVRDSMDTWPQLPLTESRPDEETEKKLIRAVSAYSRWDPEHHRYAIGRHSVPRVFDAFLKDPLSHSHGYTKL